MLGGDTPIKNEAEARPPRIAVLVPCYNEEAAIGRVVRAFRTALPGAVVYVYDNNSTDSTMEVARSAGAVVQRERHQGKGYVVRRMFADVDADVYLLVDGDATYDVPSAGAMIELVIKEQLDMVVAARVHREQTAYPRGHRAGNRLFNGFVTHIFGQSFTDMLSGYRAFSRRFVKSFPVISGGFEIEAELTIHALVLNLPVAEISTPYYARPQGSASKLNTWRDGLRILFTILKIYRAERPLPFFSAIAASLAIMSIGLVIDVLVTFLRQGVVPRLPTTILSTGLMLAALLAFTCGAILDTVTRGRREMKLLAYLQQPPPGNSANR